MPSPAAGVDRRMLFRIGGEVARATSIVRYGPGSVFPRHTHHGGEEIFVLEGVFQDEHGDYPAGSYFRNPPGTSHVPAAKDGCVIFVRLWQFRADDHVQIVRRSGEGRVVDPRPGARHAAILFEDNDETVRLEEWSPGRSIWVENSRGLEFLVLSGNLTIGQEGLEPWCWGRLPPGVPLDARVGPEAASIWIKEAPLQHPDVLELPD